LVGYPKDFKENSAALGVDQKSTVTDGTSSINANEQTLHDRVRKEPTDQGDLAGHVAFSFSQELLFTPNIAHIG